MSTVEERYKHGQYPHQEDRSPFRSPHVARIHGCLSFPCNTYQCRLSARAPKNYHASPRKRIFLENQSDRWTLRRFRTGIERRARAEVRGARDRRSRRSRAGAIAEQSGFGSAEENDRRAMRTSRAAEFGGTSGEGERAAKKSQVSSKKGSELKIEQYL